ncbi:MAG: hypothetical protein NVSMB25_23930 [Thermoleophilaceae bacterium]
MNERPFVSLIVPNRNNDPVLELFLTKLARHTTYPHFELIVVDDGSTDRSLRILRRWRDSGHFAAFRLIECEPRGIVATLNAALNAANGELVVRLDGDATIETPGWLERMLAFYSSDERIGVVVAKIVFDSGQVHSFGMNVVTPLGVHDRGTEILEAEGRRTLDINVRRPLEADAAGGDEAAEVDAAIGCCTMFSLELARRIGGFDPIWSPVAFEDFDFALSARRLGKKVFFLPDVRVIHRTTLRNPRSGDSLRELWMWRARRRVGGLFPQGVRLRVARAARIGDSDPARIALLRRHYGSWREKWGWDPVNPDMGEILARYAGTEICWAYDESMRAAGREIVAAHSARR